MDKSRRIILIVSLILLLAGAGALAYFRFRFKADVNSVWTPGVAVLTSTSSITENKLIDSNFDASNTTGWARIDDAGNRIVIDNFVDNQEGLDNSKALKVTKVSTDNYRFNQFISLNQTVAKPLKLTVNSKAENITGAVGTNFSIHLDIYFADGLNSDYGRTIFLNTGTHGWEAQELLIEENRPIKSVSFNIMFKTSIYSGTVWIDDLGLSELGTGSIVFDGQEASVATVDQPSEIVDKTIEAGDLKLSFDPLGDMNTVKIGSTSVSKLSAINGPFLKDVDDDWIKANSRLSSNNISDRTIFEDQSGTAVPELSLINSYTTDDKAISVTSRVINRNTTEKSDRPLTYYYALPLDGSWKWGGDLDKIVDTQAEMEYFAPVTGYGRTNLGATGFYNRYPVSSLCRDNQCISFNVPLDQNIITRTIYNKSLNQYFIAFDLGLTNRSIGFDSNIEVKFKISAYTITDQKDGMRAALARYYELYPGSFTRKVPASGQGLWVPFANLANIKDGNNNIATDFNIAFHEALPSNSVTDDGFGAKTLRYLSQPGDIPLRIRDSALALTYDNIINYVSSTLPSLADSVCGTPDNPIDPREPYNKCAFNLRSEKLRGPVILESGVRDINDKYRMDVSANSTMSSCLGACVNFYTNPDPGNQSVVNSMANYSWNETKASVYSDPATATMDGEFIDSFMYSSREYDFSVAHISNTSVEPSFDTANKKIVIPQIFAMTNFSSWLKQPGNLPADKLTMANFILPGLYWGASSFDSLGIEVDWLRCDQNNLNCTMVPENDSTLLFHRAMADLKPYGLLMNTNFDLFNHNLVEQYFKLATFYGFYPSFFSPGGNNVVNYFSDPDYYLRDRDLFLKYIPVIKKVNQNGWQALTGASTGDSDVRIERFGFGANNDLYFTLKNNIQQSKDITITLNRDTVLGPNNSDLSFDVYSLLSDNPDQKITTLAENSNEIGPITIAGGDTLVLQVKVRRSNRLSLNLTLQGRLGQDLDGMAASMSVIEPESNTDLGSVNFVLGADGSSHPDWTTIDGITDLSKLYDLRISVDGYLTKKIHDVNFGQVVTVDGGTMLAGNVNGDNIINWNDYNDWSASYGQSVDTKNKNDFNGDGVINYLDFAIGFGSSNWMKTEASQ